MTTQLTSQQQIALLQAQQAQQQQTQFQSSRQSAVQQPPQGAAPRAQTTTSTNGAVTTTMKHLSDGDDQYRSAKRRKPTSLSLPSKFVPSLSAASSSLGPTDQTLSSSLTSLEHLSSSYKSLQEIESRLDWTFSRKIIELNEKTRASGSDEGERSARTMRIWTEVEVRDQEWMFENEEETKEAAEDREKVPRLEVKIKGKIQDDDERTLEPFTRHYQRISIESPLLSSPLVWNRSTSFPSVLSFVIPLSIPSPSLSSSSSTSIPLKITLHPYSYPHSPNSQLFTLLPPDLASLLSLSECTRSEALHALWSYVRSNGLILENIDGRGTGGIKVEEGNGGLGKRFFGGVERVGWHHLGEWVNRWLGPVVPRVVDAEFKVHSTETLSSHQAFDLPLSIFPFSASTSSRSKLSQKTVSLLSTFQPPPPPQPSSSSTDSSTPPQGGLLQALESLNSQISTSSLEVTRRKLQLDSLLSFTRNPTKFLQAYLASQSSSLETVLSSNGRGDQSGGGMELGVGVGDGWKESLRGSRYFSEGGGNDVGDGKEGEGEGWVKEAVGVWLAREREGELKKLIAANRQGTVSGGEAMGGQQGQQQMGYVRR
ncbi:uncharacterized protein JCM6883_005454 [Sporobolomyces salmoneus]|uniref:uncharacterized protein n=1 Tax=Sporobolomyces salmoneus TaxID=183962 RepID=UPI0031770C79